MSREMHRLVAHIFYRPLCVAEANTEMKKQQHYAKHAWKMSADGILKYFSFFLTKQDLPFMPIVSIIDNWHECKILFSRKNRENKVNYKRFFFFFFLNNNNNNKTTTTTTTTRKQCPSALNPARIFILVGDTLSCPALHFYQVSSKYFEGYSCYKADTKSNLNTRRGVYSKSKKVIPVLDTLSGPVLHF